MIHNDEPTLIDTLDRSFLLKEVASAVAGCAPPQVFGIHGDWGLGKTSFLHQLQLYLTGQCPQQREEEIKQINVESQGTFKTAVTAVWFDAWRYQYEQAPVVALLQEMRSQLSWSIGAIDETQRNTEIAIRGALLSIEEVTKKIGFQYSKFVEARRDWEENNLATALPSHTLREHLCDAIGKLLPSYEGNNDIRPRLVVFIDDVDRCEPEIAYRLLEGLKIYLTLDNCVFVLGMNQKAVADAIAQRMAPSYDEYRLFQEAAVGAIINRPNPSSSPSPDEISTVLALIDSKINSRAAAYMEKLCQNVWQLPTVRNPKSLLDTLLQSSVENATMRRMILSVVDTHNCLPPNPRRLKGLANVIGQFTSRLIVPEQSKDEMVESDELKLQAHLLLIVSYVYHFHTDLYVRWEADLNFYDKIVDRCNDIETNISVLSALIMPQRIIENESEPVPPQERENTHPDPSEIRIFWIQPLVVDLATEVTADMFAPYLGLGTS